MRTSLLPRRRTARAAAPAPFSGTSGPYTDPEPVQTPEKPAQGRTRTRAQGPNPNAVHTVKAFAFWTLLIGSLIVFAVTAPPLHML